MASLQGLGGHLLAPWCGAGLRHGAHLRSFFQGRGLGISAFPREIPVSRRAALRVPATFRHLNHIDDVQDLKSTVSPDSCSRSQELPRSRSLGSCREGAGFGAEDLRADPCFPSLPPGKGISATPLPGCRLQGGYSCTHLPSVAIPDGCWPMKRWPCLGVQH